jgi:3-oxoacyl-[acyl-carrier protein] reductase
MEVSLKGRVAIITGGSKGLGRAIAARMAESGADVAMIARESQALEEAKAAIEKLAKGRVSIFSCDVKQADAIAKTYAEIMSEFGRVDIVVNNAGVSQTGDFMSITDEVWQGDLD